MYQIPVTIVPLAFIMNGIRTAVPDGLKPASAQSHPPARVTDRVALQSGFPPWGNGTSPKNCRTVGCTGIASTQVDGNGQAWASTHASKTRQLTIPHRHNEPDSCDDCIVSIHIRLIRTAVPELYHIPHTQSPSQPIPCHKATDTDYYVRLFTNFTTGGRSP